MNADRQEPRPSPRMEGVLRAVLPIGVGLLVLWLVWVGAALVVGVEAFGLGVVSALLGLVTSVCLIVTGHLNRRELDRRGRDRR